METDHVRARLREERRRLEALLAGHRQVLDGPPARLGELSGNDQHQADEASEMYDREDTAGRIARAEAELAAVERAEARLADGTYGRSVESGDPIPDERLEHLPAAERTVEEERRHRSAPDAARDEDDDATPLDEDEGPVADLGSIPMSREHEPVVDPQEDGDRVELDIGGEVYAGEGGAPAVGEPEPDDDAVDRAYRPDD